MKTKNLFTLFALFGTLFTSCVYNPNTKERIEENLEETLIEEKSYSTEEIEYISIDCIYEDIKINTTEKSEIFVQLMSNNPSKIPEIKIKNNTFSVTSKVKNEIHPLSCTVYISLPKDFNQKDIKIIDSEYGENTFLTIEITEEKFKELNENSHNLNFNILSQALIRQKYIKIN